MCSLRRLCSNLNLRKRYLVSAYFNKILKTGGVEEAVQIKQMQSVELKRGEPITEGAFCIF